jgi:hypothetical protein
MAQMLLRTTQQHQVTVPAVHSTAGSVCSATCCWTIRGFTDLIAAVVCAQLLAFVRHEACQRITGNTLKSQRLCLLETLLSACARAGLPSR